MKINFGSTFTLTNLTQPQSDRLFPKISKYSAMPAISTDYDKTTKTDTIVMPDHFDNSFKALLDTLKIIYRESKTK